MSTMIQSTRRAQEMVLLLSAFFLQWYVGITQVLKMGDTSLQGNVTRGYSYWTQGQH